MTITSCKCLEATKDEASVMLRNVNLTCCVQRSTLTSNLLVAVVSPGTTSTWLTRYIDAPAYGLLSDLKLAQLNFKSSFSHA